MPPPLCVLRLYARFPFPRNGCIIRSRCGQRIPQMSDFCVKCCQAAHRTCTALIVVAIATTVIVMATAVELASNGPLGRVPVSDVNVEPVRVFKELQA
jgi:hypothetical protein